MSGSRSYRKYDLEDIMFRIRNGAAVSPDEWAAVLQQDHSALLDFMALNNPGNVTKTLKYELGYHELPFFPNPQACVAQIEVLKKTNSLDKLQKVYDNFKYNPFAENWTSNEDLRAELKKEFPNWFQ